MNRGMRGSLSSSVLWLLILSSACTETGDGASLNLSAELGPMPTASGAGMILRLDPRFDALVPPGAVIERVADGFEFLEGPVWIREDSRLIFSDLGANSIYEWTESGGPRVLIENYYDGSTEGLGNLFGSNGLTRDSDGQIVIGDHGRRQVTRLESDGSQVALVDSFEGARLNSPNDVVYRSDGWLYFTDPPYGLDGGDDSPLKELDFNGIYRLGPDGDLELLSSEQSRPNGLAFSPDENTLYVANCDGEQAVWMAYDVSLDGLSNARVLAEANTRRPETGCPDGLKVDRQGNVFATGPGGVWIIAPDGTHLGTIAPTENPANVGWGEDGRTLYMTARTGLYRIRLIAEGPIP
jgi:gluconolactonase